MLTHPKEIKEALAKLHKDLDDIDAIFLVALRKGGGTTVAVDSDESTFYSLVGCVEVTKLQASNMKPKPIAPVQSRLN